MKFGTRLLDRINSGPGLINIIILFIYLFIFFFFFLVCSSIHTHKIQFHGKSIVIDQC